MIMDDKIRVRFVTEFEQYRITDAPFSLPSKLGRSGLSEVINHLLDTKSQPFDFMINGNLIRVPLQKFLSLHQDISTETIIKIVYFPATSLSEESESVEVPAWIGSIDTNLSNVVVAGCYDGSTKFFNSSDLSELNSIATHDDPVRAVVSWITPLNKSNGNLTSLMATASKDQVVKCWDVSDVNNIVNVATLSGHVNSVEALSVWKPVGQQSHDTVLLSADWTGVLFGWNVSTLGSEVMSKEVDVHDKKKRKKAADFMGTVTASSTSVMDLKPLFTIKAHAQSISGISSSRMGENNSIFTGSWDHALKEWDLERQDCVATFASSKVVTSVDCSSVSSSSMMVATSHPDGKVRCWDPRQASEASVAKLSFGKGTQWISQVKWLPGSSLVFSAADYAGNITLWDIRASVPLGTTEVHSGKALCLNWLFDESSQSKVLSGGSDCFLKSTAVHQ